MTLALRVKEVKGEAPSVPTYVQYIDFQENYIMCTRSIMDAAKYLDDMPMALDDISNVLHMTGNDIVPEIVEVDFV